ncbi:hypothetical protein [Plesiomonas shigelloides]|uniref:hypothetical protein n=1 Tax=Plesiomonas shigelloides TaxID=703 RepID=UPI00126183A5|nr:hypothetical protein [Plesiomonas shigelloides]KAB7683130.1 hypothetical protein GBN23_03665 [Plesiomonas shigelloides]MCQ8860056.1 hypothetical protein [Plesiomonas shigelloides]
MKFIYVIFLIFLASIVNAGEIEEYQNKLDIEYEALLQEIPSNEQGAWKERSYDITQKVLDEGASHEQIVEYFKQQGTYDSYESTLPFSYLKKVQYIRLDMKTSLVNELGAYVYSDFYDKEVKLLLVAIETELSGLQNTQGALQLQGNLSKYFRIKRKVEELTNTPVILSELEFRPASSSWDTAPKLMKKFTLYDWRKTIEALNDYKSELNDINDSFISFNKLRLKDPVGYISFGSQIAVLLITVAGYIISYTKKPSLVVISLLVVSSMVLSLVMISISSSTLFNIAIQAMLPGAFIVYWTVQKRISSISKKKHNKLLKSDG